MGRGGWWLGICLAGLTACSPFHKADPERLDVALDVPFYAQQRDRDCAAAALTSLMAYAGRRVDLQAVDRAVYTPAIGGSLLPDMENYLRRQGMQTSSGRGDPGTLRRVLDRGIPLVIPLDLGRGKLRRPHYVVVHGYGPEGFLVHAGHREAVLVDSGELERRWRRMGFLYLYLDD